MPAKTKEQLEKENEALRNDFMEVKRMFNSVVERLDIIDNTIRESVASISAVEKKVEVAGDKLEAVEGELATLKANYSALLKRIETLDGKNKSREEDSLLNKISINELYQQRRMFTVHFLNVPEEITDADLAAKLLFDRYILPSFSNLKESEIPNMYNVIEFAHLLPANPDAKTKFPGFKYICKFTTRFYKLRFFLQKKRILDACNEGNAAKVKCTHDYTKQNRVVLDMLHNEALVKKVTVRGTRIMYKLDVESSWKVVRNPYAAVIADLDVLPGKQIKK